MLTSKLSSDVTLRVGKDGKTVRAHRYVLISRSHVFEEMLSGPLTEKDNIKISDVEANVFSEMLTFLYTDCVTVTHENVNGLLFLAKKYAVRGLEKLCLIFLETNLNAENACMILEQAHRFDEKWLYDKAYKLVLQKGNKCCASESFKCLSRDCFENVIRSDDLIILPQNAFEAAIGWAEAQCRREGTEITPANLRSILGDTVYRIPFTSMSEKFYVNNVVPKGILTDAEHLNLMSWFLCPERDSSPFIRGKDFVLHDGHKRLIGAPAAQTSVYRRVDFMCSHCVTLRSVCLYGQQGGGGDVSCKIGGSFVFDTFFRKSVPLRRSDEMLGEFCIKRYHLDTPVNVRGNDWYYIEVEMKRCCPNFVGDRQRKTVKV
ncbi:BTB/POZ domain-containing protein 6-like [Haliotis asinina]|uniref:BTB/POZ domain-containing protein 6-like n=1 Tax=Haliotis asinina TaxID=109174 RepID=UPI003531ED69